MRYGKLTRRVIGERLLNLPITEMKTGRHTYRCDSPLQYADEARYNVGINNSHGLCCIAVFVLLRITPYRFPGFSCDSSMHPVPQAAASSQAAGISATCPRATRAPTPTLLTATPR